MFRRSVVLFAVFCVFAALLPAGASAHELAPTAHQVEAGTERVLDGYKNGKQIGTKQVLTGYQKVRVEPRWDTVPDFNYVDVPQYEDVVTKKFVGYKKTRIPPYTKSVEVFNYETVCLYLGCYQVRVEPRWITVAAYYYVDVPQYEDVVTKKFVGYKKTRIPPYTKSVEVFNYENQPVYESQPIYEQVPVYKTVTKYETQYRCPADHNLKNGKCVHPKTTKPDPTPIAVSCSAGQYAPPLPDGQNGREPVWIHITTQKVIDHATYQQVGLTSRSLYEQPAWEKVGTAPECYTPKLKEATKVNVVELIIDGITYVIESGKAVIKAASDLAGKAKDAVEKASRTYAENLYRTARLAFDAFCSAPGQVLSGAVAGYALAQTTIAASATAALAASSVTVVAAGATAIVAVSAAAIAGTAIWLGCKYVIDNIVPDTDDDSDTDDSDTDTDDTDDTDTESRAEKEARVAALRAQWMAMLPNAVKDEQKCAGICWDDPANAELLRVYQAWLALLKELYG